MVLFQKIVDPKYPDENYPDLFLLGLKRRGIQQKLIHTRN
jgi:hypothetical protein